MEVGAAIRTCILGHSGIGKSPLANLFKVGGWEPYRVRKPRDATDVAMNPSEFQQLKQVYASAKPIYDGSAKNNNLRVYADWSFFTVRTKDQCLEHTPRAKNAAIPLRIEIYAPVLLELLEDLPTNAAPFSLNPENLLIVLLNPTDTSFGNMETPSDELKLATVLAVSERYRAMRKIVDIADCLERARHLTEELKAWRGLLKNNALTVVECMNWPHFEYRYRVGDPNAELLAARTLLVDSVKKRDGSLASRLEALIRAPDEIRKLEMLF